MPKAKKHSMKRRSKGKHYIKTKRGGMEEPSSTKGLVTFYDPRTGKPKDTGNVRFYNIQKGETPLNPTGYVSSRSSLPESTLDEVKQTFDGPNPEEKMRLQREKEKEEYDKLMKKYEDVKYEDECAKTGCNISGGRKTSRYRRKGRKSRKSRKHHKSRKH